VEFTKSVGPPGSGGLTGRHALPIDGAVDVDSVEEGESQSKPAPLGFRPASPLKAASDKVLVVVRSISAFATLKLVVFDAPLAPIFVADRFSIEVGQ
jgi:hypothetical protein